MESGTSATADEPAPVLYRWTARRVHPLVLLYVASVFAAFMAIAHFALHSTTAVKALALAAIGFLVPLVPAVIVRIEYRLTEAGLERRLLARKTPGEFREVFRWSQLDRVIPMRHGLKFTKVLRETNPWRRFWKTHLSDAFSGEVHLEAPDREPVLGILAERHGSP